MSQIEFVWARLCRRVRFTALATIFVALPARAASPYLEADTTPLFASYETLRVKMTAPFNQMFKAGRGAWAKGSIEVAGKSIPFEARARGQYTLTACNFPKLMLKFKMDDIRGTLFEGHPKIDVGTHCDHKKEMAAGTDRLMEAMAVNYREAIIYRLADVLGIPAYSTRPMRVTYADTSPEPVPLPDGEYWAFFVEHEENVVRRAKGIEIEHISKKKPGQADDPGVRYVYKGPDHHPEIDWDSLARMDVFQHFIGNYDCRLNDDEIHNHKLIQIPSGKWIAVPQDFNFASLAYSDDAGASQYAGMGQLPVRVPKERIKEILKEFIGKRAELMAALKWLEFDPATKKVFEDTIDGMFNEFATQVNPN